MAVCRYFSSVQEALKDSRFQAAYAKLHTEPAAEKINEFQAIARYGYALPEDVTQELIAEAQASARPDFPETEGVSEAGISENLSAAPGAERPGATAGPNQQTSDVGFSFSRR